LLKIQDMPKVKPRLLENFKTHNCYLPNEVG